MKCTYCGEHGDSLDHVIPHSYDHVYKKRSYNRKEVVPACTGEKKRGEGMIKIRSF
jgi:5-methylcytosine-specific restriction endonuclease McrA